MSQSAQSAPVPPAAAPRAAPGPKFDSRQWLDQQLAKEIEYKPFRSGDSIKLSARLVLRFFTKPTKTGKLCPIEQAIRFVMLCKSRGLNPWEGDAYIVGYDNKDGTAEFQLVTAHQAYLKRLVAEPNFEGMESGVVLDDGQKIAGDIVPSGGKLIGGWATIYMKNLKIPVCKLVPLTAFNKGYGRWLIDPAGMIVKCAEADAMRTAVPNSCTGMYLAEELVEAEAIMSEPAGLTKPEQPALEKHDPTSGAKANWSPILDHRVKNALTGVANWPRPQLRTLKTLVQIYEANEELESCLLDLGLRGAEEEAPVDLDKFDEDQCRVVLDRLSLRVQERLPTPAMAGSLTPADNDPQPQGEP